MMQIRAFFHNKKAATVFDSRCASKIALLAVVLLLSAYHGCTNNSAAAYEQNGKPQSKAAVVAGLRRRCVAGFILRRVCRICRMCCRTVCGNFNGCFLITADGAFLMLGSLLGCGRFLVGNPLEGVRRRVRLVPAGTFVPVVCFVILPIRTVAMGMGSCRRCHSQVGFDPKALHIAVITYTSVPPSVTPTLVNRVIPSLPIGI